MANAGAKMSLSFLAIALIACAKEAPKEETLADVPGACADVYGAQVCTYARTQGDKVMEVGAVVPLASIENAPAEGGMDWPPVAVATLDMPPSAQAQSGLTQFTMYWEAHGHPPGPYLTPHFDFHFYTISKADIAAIDCSDLAKPSAMPATYSLPDVPLPPDMAKLTGVPTLVGLCVPQMGMHAVLTSELESTQPFSGSLVLGYYHGNPIFVEPMLTKTMLMEQKSFDLPVPEIPGITGPHPTRFHAEFDPANQAYRFTYSGFVATS
jgi:hypothetical protein